MTPAHSTYTYETGEQETVTLKRGPATPHGHALLKIEYSDGQIVDCYVNTAWLRDRANDLDPRPHTPDAITDEMVFRAQLEWERRAGASPIGDTIREVLIAALTEPPPRPEGAEQIERLIETSPWHLAGSCSAEADWLAEHGVRVVGENEDSHA